MCTTELALFNLEANLDPAGRLFRGATVSARFDAELTIDECSSAGERRGSARHEHGRPTSC